MDWVTTRADWQDFCAEAMAESVIAISLRTSGPDPLSDEVVFVSLATSTRTAILDVAALGGPTAAADLLRPLISGKARVKAFYNAKTALRFLLSLDIVPQRIFDSLLAEQLLAAGQMTQEPTLVDSARRLLARDLGKPTPGDSLALTSEVRAIYDLRQHLVPKLVQASLVPCAQIEFECTVPTAAMEQSGMRFDVPRLEAIIRDGEARMTASSQSFVQAFATAGDGLFGSALVNLQSDAQVLAFLQTHGVPVKRVNRSSLKPLLGRFPGLEHLFSYRNASTDRALEGYLRLVHPTTGRVHPTYSQLAAATGRFGCSNPNMQSFPRSPRHRACVVPAPGHTFILADYSQIELRIAAQISRDKRMLTAFRDGRDLHILTASIVTGKPPQEISAQERQAAKAVNFGLVYAMGARGLAAYAEQTYGVEMSLAQAEDFRRRFFAAYRGVASWHERVRLERPTLVRTLSGRQRRVPAGVLSQALNSPVQGTGADILKRALVLLFPALRAIGANVIGVVHDEVLVEVPDEQIEVARAAVSRLMEQAAREFLTDVPCPVTAAAATSWAGKC